jgi:hypothetical protein
MSSSLEKLETPTAYSRHREKPWLSVFELHETVKVKWQRNSYLPCTDPASRIGQAPEHELEMSVYRWERVVLR